MDEVAWFLAGVIGMTVGIVAMIACAEWIERRQEDRQWWHVMRRRHRGGC